MNEDRYTQPTHTHARTHTRKSYIYVFSLLIPEPVSKLCIFKNIQETSTENGKNSLLLVLSSWLVLTPVLAEVTDLGEKKCAERLFIAECLRLLRLVLLGKIQNHIR